MSIFKDIRNILRDGAVMTKPSGTASDEMALAAAGDYAAEDVLSNNATTGRAWYWPKMARRKGGGGKITKASALCSTTALALRLTIYLFRSQPTSALTDNAANTAVATADRYKYVGRIELPAMSDLGGNSEAIATPDTGSNLPLKFRCAQGEEGLWGIVVTEDAITGEAAGMGLKIEFEIEEQD